MLIEGTRQENWSYCICRLFVDFYHITNNLVLLSG